VSAPHRWSDPYHGVQHLLGTSEAYQLTVENYGRMSVASVLHLRSEAPFTSFDEASFATPEEARAWCEKRPEAQS